MRIHWICKSRYTNKDLLRDRFGRLFHIPVEQAKLGATVSVAALDYRDAPAQCMEQGGARFYTLPAAPWRWPLLARTLYQDAARHQPEVIIGSGDSHIGYWALRVAQKLNCPCIFDIYDYYPVFKGNRLPGMAWMFRHAASKADALWVASHSLEKRLQPLNPQILRVENGVDQALFSAQGENQRSQLGLASDTPVVGYFGSITADRGPLLFAACDLLRAKGLPLVLLLAGPVSGIQLPQRPWLRYLGNQDQAHIPSLIRTCNVATLPYGNDPFNAMCGACKIAEYLACGVPVVATEVSGHARIFSSAPASLCAPEATAMASALEAQLRQAQIAPFPDAFSWANIGQKVLQQLGQLRR